MTREEAIEIFRYGLSSFMLRKDYTNNDVAKVIDTTHENVSMLRKGKSTPKFTALLSLVDDGMNLKEIFGEERAKRLVGEFVKESSENSPIETARQAQGVLKLLLAQVEKLQNGDA